jgi:hypothetical protein
MATVVDLGSDTGPNYFFWDNETYLDVAWNSGTHQLEGEWVQPDIAGAPTAPWGATRKSVPLNGQPVIGYDMKEYTVYETLALTPVAVPFTVTCIAFCPLTDVLGVLFTMTSGESDYSDGVSVAAYNGFAIHAWPISSSGLVGNPLEIGNQDFDGHFGVTTHTGYDFQPNGFVTDSPTRVRLLDAVDNSDLVLDVTPTALTFVSGPAAWSNGPREWGMLDAYENYEGECWYVSGIVAAKVAKNAAGERVRSVDIVGAGFDVDPFAHTIARVGGDEAVIMTTYGLTGFSYPDCQWACFIVKGGVVSKIDIAWATVNHQYVLVDTPLDEFQTLIVLRLDVTGGGDSPWPTQSIGSSGGDWSIGAFDYPALVKQDLDWQVLLVQPSAGSGGGPPSIVRPTLQGAIVVNYMSDGGVRLIQIGGNAADYIGGSAHFDR